MQSTTAERIGGFKRASVCPSVSHTEPSQLPGVASAAASQLGAAEPSSRQQPAAGTSAPQNDDRIVVRIKVPKAFMPYRWRDRPQFSSCLLPSHTPTSAAVGPTSNSAGHTEGRPAIGANAILNSETIAPTDSLVDSGLFSAIVSLACSMDLAAEPVDGASWLTSPLIDFVTMHFAREYQDIHFLPCEFLAFDLPRAARSNESLAHYRPTDLLGNVVQLPSPLSKLAIRRTVRSDSIAATMRTAHAAAVAATPLSVRAAAAATAALAVSSLPPAALPRVTEMVKRELQNQADMDEVLAHSAPAFASGPATQVTIPDSAPYNVASRLASLQLQLGRGAPVTARPYHAMCMLNVTPIGCSSAWMHTTMCSSLRAFVEHPLDEAGRARERQELEQEQATQWQQSSLGASSSPNSTNLEALHGRWWLADTSLQRSQALAELLPPLQRVAFGLHGAPTKRSEAPSEAPSTPKVRLTLCGRRRWGYLLSWPPTEEELLSQWDQYEVAAAKHKRLLHPNMPDVHPRQGKSPFGLYVAGSGEDAERLRKLHNFFRPSRDTWDQDGGRAFIRVKPANRGKPIMCFSNVGNNHWNLLRIAFSPVPSIEVYEPMGKPGGRRSGMSMRTVPRPLVAWLDSAHPIPGGWQDVASSAIEAQQQQTGFDCGVACLLYAEKCAQGQQPADVGKWTDQEEITEFRVILQDFFRTLSSQAE